MSIRRACLDDLDISVPGKKVYTLHLALLTKILSPK